ncbi:MAG: PKD domain-containing protein, partial [Bacteroidia bacterium]|nr:PKD domain-containing protein [Bacteroidia bacterium]
SLIQNQTIYVYPSISSPTMICAPANNLCGGPGFDPGITNVTFGSINNSTNFIFNNYFDYSCCKNTTVTMGNTYPISITTAYQNGEFVSVWIDYNNDGVFNTTTEVAMTGFAFPTINSSITIPTTTAFNQKLRMRVVSDIDSLSANACSFYCGEIEDYSVTILPAIINPISSFSSTPTVGCTTSIAFTNTSYNGTSYSWNFGDGSPLDTTSNPTHVYLASGTYSVSLITCNPYGCDTIIQTETITIPQLPISSSCVPVLSPMTPFTEITVFKVDTTYDFGGTIWESVDPNSENQTCTNQLHLNAASTYYFKCYINLPTYRGVNYWIDYNNDGVFTTNEYINSPLSIGYAHSNGIVPTIVQISESAVLNTPLRMRVVVFDGPLPVILGGCPNGSGYDGLYHDYTVFIGPPQPTVSDFSIWGASPCTNNPVNFLNSSLHATSYLWDYGDGTTDTTMDGSHIYATPGTYTVKLTTSNSLYTDSLVRTNYVTVLPSLPVPSLTLTGTILSTGSTASGYKWYKDNVLINGAVSSSYDIGLISGVYKYAYSPVHANFTISPTTGCDTTLIFLDNLSINATSYIVHWGDGTTTTSATGAGYHSYSPGIYTVQLVACNGTSCDSLMLTNYITIGTAASVPVISLSGGVLTTSSIEPSYQWNLNGSAILGATSSNYTPLTDGDYSLTVTNYSGCTATSAIHHFYPIHPGFYTSTPMYCGSATSGILLINTTTNATSYLWDFGDGTTSTDSDPFHSFPPIGTFTVKLIACNGTECDSITQLNYITTDSTIITPVISAMGDTAVCPGYSVDLVTNNVSGYTYQWKVNGNYLGASDTLYTAGSTGEYVLEATTPFGCVGISNQINVSIENCVWPGDADGMSSVDNYDLLPIGLYYGQTGPARASVSNSWQAYPASNWGILYPPFSTDIKNADCNGDGIVDDNDTLAINLNFSSVHPLVQHPSDLRATDPMLTFTSSQSIYAPGDWVDIDIWVGSNLQPVYNLYGIAFNLQFDPNLTKAGTERLLYPIGLMGAPGTHTLTIEKTDRTAGYAYGAITRKTHTNISGSGLLARFHFQIDSAISAVNTLFFTIDNYISNDSAGSFIPLTTSYYSIDIDPNPTTISSSFIKESELSIYPNPYLGFTHINYSLPKNAFITLDVFNSIGQKIETLASENQQAGNHRYSFSAKAKGYEPGVYFVKMTIDGVTTTKRIIEIE